MILVIQIFDDEAGAVRSEVNRARWESAQTLFEAIESVFIQDGIPFENMLGFGSDGANAMLGRHNSEKTTKNSHNSLLYIVSVM